MGLTIILAATWLLFCAVGIVCFIIGRHWRNEELIAIQLENIHLRGTLERADQANRDLKGRLHRLEVATFKEAVAA